MKEELSKKRDMVNKGKGQRTEKERKKKRKKERKKEVIIRKKKQRYCRILEKEIKQWKRINQKDERRFFLMDLKEWVQ